MRSLLLTELARYRRRGRFPVNPDFEEPTPYFVDAQGTRCAMAHLLELGGEAALVRRIATTRNNARVRELADERRLLAWLDAAGISVAEAALIQPTYCHWRTECVCGGNTSAWPVLEAVAVTASQGDGTLTASVEAIHGASFGLVVGDEFVAEVEDAGAGDPLVINAFTGADGGARYVGRVFEEPYVCQPGVPPLTREQYAEATSSIDCEDRLIAMNSGFAPDEDCGDMYDCGCRIPGGAGSDPTTVGILVAVLSAVAARRALRRRFSRFSRAGERTGRARAAAETDGASAVLRSGAGREPAPRRDR
ncbi:MAG TPA: hypothetical protein VGK73_23290 [Polyangiaceae bacterium]